MADRTDNHAAALDRVQHAVIADTRGPQTLETPYEPFAGRLGLGRDECDCLDDSFANGRR
jgi:hypothetical protein